MGETIQMYNHGNDSISDELGSNMNTISINLIHNDVKDAELLRKCFREWRKTIKEKKTIAEHTKRDDQIQEFIEKLLKEKEKLLHRKDNQKIMKKSFLNDDEILAAVENDKSNDSKPDQLVHGNYHHRFQAQKYIIALQNAKLEQQKRYIEELKLNKIVDGASSSINLINEIKSTMTHCSLSVKPKLKSVIREVNSNDSNSDENLYINCMKIPKFLQNMEKRAREREERRRVVAERRRQIEMERERIKQQKQLEKQLLDQEERERRLDEFQENRRREQLLAIQRKKFNDRIRALLVMADLFHEKKLISKYGIPAFKLFVQKVKEDNLTAERFNTMRIMRNNFVKWKTTTQNIVAYKNDKADNLYQFKLVSRAFAEIKKTYKDMKSKWHTAEDWYEQKIVDQLFIRWRDVTLKQKAIREELWILAVQHYERQLLWGAIGNWQKLPTVNRLEREQESRKQRWRMKVQQVLPDFVSREYI